MFWTRKKLLVTHPDDFHLDDVFACATLTMVLDRRGEKYKLIRTRDTKIIESADYVWDVGGIYSPDKNRFDHHQLGGSGKRENGIEYASFGLVWKEFGEELCGQADIARDIESRLVSPIDATDNGQSVSKSVFEGVNDYSLFNVINILFHPLAPGESYDSLFLKAVTFARRILAREILFTAKRLREIAEIREIYKNSPNKQILNLDKHFSRGVIFEALNNEPEVLYIVYQRTNKLWSVLAMRDRENYFQSRKDLPKSWAGLRDGEFARVSGVSDAVFCHRGRFLAVSESREGAQSLAEKALEN